MIDSLSRQTIGEIYKDMDLKEYLASAIDSSYDGLCMFRPSVEHVNDRFYQDMFAGGTVIKFSHWDEERYPMFKVITSSSRYAGETVFVPFPLLQKMSGKDFRPWNINSVVRRNLTDAWELVVDYTDTAEVIVQDLVSGAMSTRKLEDVTHGSMYTKYGNAPYPIKGSSGVKLNEEQSKQAGLPVGTVAPFVSFEVNPGGDVMCKLQQVDVMFPYSELVFIKTNNRLFSRLVACIENPRFHDELF